MCTFVIDKSVKVDSVSITHNADSQPEPDLVAVIGNVFGLSIFINGRETGIRSLSNERCHAVAYARNGPLFVATDRKIFRLDASVGLPIDPADDRGRSGDSGQAHAIIADQTIQALAVDDIGRKVYWVVSTDLPDAGVSALNVDNYNGSDRRTLFRLPANQLILSRTLAVDSLHACLLFFVDVTRDSLISQKQLHIRRLDGQSLGIVQRISDADEISAVAIDAENAIIYWMESSAANSAVQIRGLAYSSWLSTSPSSTPSPFALLEISKTDQPAKVLAYQRQHQRIYWIRGAEVVACSAAPSAALTAGTSATVCRPTLTRLQTSEPPFHLVVLSMSEYKSWPAAYTDICASRKPCGHLCFRHSSSADNQNYSCLCRYGLLPDPSNATHACRSAYVDYLLISLEGGKRSSVLKMSLDTQDYHSAELFQVPKFIVKCLAVDPLASVVYWIDYLHEKVSASGLRSATEAIRKAPLLNVDADAVAADGPVQFEKILENADEVPLDLAVDWASRNLYWVTQRKLHIARLDGRHQYVLATFDKVTAVKVDPIR